MVVVVLCVLVAVGFCALTVAAKAPPSVIATILIDDLGFYDTAVFNDAIRPVTPHLAQLADDGIRLERHYTYKYCSPTRRSFLSGRYPIHITGTQALVCSNCLPLEFTLLSEKFAGAGWLNHFVGKGHLGYTTMDHLPINRGFASHVGYLFGMEDYQYGNHTRSNPVWNQSNASDVYWFTKDFWDGLLPATDAVTDEIYYSTNWYTDRAIEIIDAHPLAKNLWLHLPYQAVHSPYTDTPAWEDMPESCTPQAGNASCPFWDHTFGDMLTVVDAGIGNVTAALQKRGMYNNALYVVSSDNGGIGPGNNFCGAPCGGDSLRGHKMTPWEGGTRVMAFVSGGWLEPGLRGTFSRSFVHISDWYPTLLSLVGVDPSDDITYRGVKAGIDGVNVWPMITKQNLTSPRDFLPVTEVSLIWKEQWKLLVDAGPTNYYTANCTHIPDDGRGCSSESPCLFDLQADPAERHNLASEQPSIVARLTQQLESYQPYVTCHMTEAELEPYECPSPAGEKWGSAAGYSYQFAGPCCFRKNTR